MNPTPIGSSSKQNDVDPRTRTLDVGVRQKLVHESQVREDSRIAAVGRQHEVAECLRRAADDDDIAVCERLQICAATFSGPDRTAATPRSR